jgi:glutathione S-transferase
MVQIYGSPRSSAGRCFLMLEEVGVPYQVMPLDMREKQHKSAAFLKLNPNGKVPCLVDGDYVIWESVAINYYLAEKYKPELLGRSPEERGHIVQWSTWSMVDLQPPLVDILIQMLFVPEDKRDMNLVAKSKEKVPPMLQILDTALNGRDYIVGKSLTVADLNLASVVNLAGALGLDTTTHTGLNSWFQRIKQRPSFQKFAELRT